MEYLKNFWSRRDFRAIFEDFPIIKRDKYKNVSEYDLYEYIDEEKKSEKKLQKNGATILRGIADILANFNFATIFWKLPHNEK